jgi:hypothetical protein
MTSTSYVRRAAIALILIFLLTWAYFYFTASDAGDFTINPVLCIEPIESQYKDACAADRDD